MQNQWIIIQFYLITTMTISKKRLTQKSLTNIKPIYLWILAPNLKCSYKSPKAKIFITQGISIMIVTLTERYSFRQDTNYKNLLVTNNLLTVIIRHKSRSLTSTIIKVGRVTYIKQPIFTYNNKQIINARSLYLTTLTF